MLQSKWFVRIGVLLFVAALLVLWERQSGRGVMRPPGVPESAAPAPGTVPAVPAVPASPVVPAGR